VTSPEKRIVMAKRVVERWLQDHLAPEYRLTIYCAGEELTRVPGLLRAFRNGRVNLASVKLDGNLGLSVGFDYVTLWGTSRTMMAGLDKWFLGRGYETTGVW
jgi:hypothetical protein